MEGRAGDAAWRGVCAHGYSYSYTRAPRARLQTSSSLPAKSPDTLPPDVATVERMPSAVSRQQQTFPQGWRDRSLPSRLRLAHFHPHGLLLH